MNKNKLKRSEVLAQNLWYGYSVLLVILANAAVVLFWGIVADVKISFVSTLFYLGYFSGGVSWYRRIHGSDVAEIMDKEFPYFATKMFFYFILIPYLLCLFLLLLQHLDPQSRILSGINILGALLGTFSASFNAATMTGIFVTVIVKLLLWLPQRRKRKNY